MRLEELDVEVPAELIAQRPVEKRDHSRLLVADPGSGGLSHRSFFDLPEVVEPGDLLVLNDSRVLPARLHVRRETGGAVELLFLRTRPARSGTGRGGGTGGGGKEVWEVLARPSQRLREGEVLAVHKNEACNVRLEEGVGGGRWSVSVLGGWDATGVLARYGDTPLPPYIREPVSDPGQYQTVYAREPGSAAAPTAGLHFTPDLLGRLTERGVEPVFVTLHVGLDTFLPIREEVIEDHPIHSEQYQVGERAVRTIDRARREGRRVIAVGTTVVRVLETLYWRAPAGGEATGPRSGTTALFITPGYEFRAVDALLTNFHLPRTSLLALVMAFGGTEFIRRAYREAVGTKYRFYSFGDAMLIAGRGRAE